MDNLVAVACDGYGYGPDGDAWGGEILQCSSRSKDFTRLAHLEPQPLLGGDLATRYPIRIAAGILQKQINIEEWLLKNSHHLPHGEAEAKLILTQLQKKERATETTSCGRILDAVAAVLGICYARTYEGEPAMKLESAAFKGKDVLKMKPTSTGNVLDTTKLLVEIFQNQNKFSVADLAYSAHAYLAKGLANLALQAALKNDIDCVGFTGGSAVNEILATLMRKAITSADLQFIVHEAVPPGDGGVSFGQAVVGGFDDS